MNDHPLSTPRSLRIVTMAVAVLYGRAETIKYFFIVAILLGSTSSFSQQTKCDPVPKPWPDIKPIVPNGMCWEDWEIPNQEQHLKTLLPKVKNGKIPGFYVSLYDTIRNDYETVFSPDTYDTTENGSDIANAGELHVLDYNRDSRPDIIAENKISHLESVVQFWRNDGDSLGLDFSLSGYIASIDGKNKQPEYMWLHQTYCCEYSIVHVQLFKNIVTNGRHKFTVVEKWIYHMNGDLLIPQKFTLNTPFQINQSQELYVKRRELRNKYFYIEQRHDQSIEHKEDEGKLFIPCATVAKGAKGTVLHSEQINGEEWCFVIFEKGTILEESTFSRHRLTRSPEKDVKKIRYLGWVKRSNLLLAGK